MKTSTKVEIGIPLLLVISDCIAVLLSYLISYELRFFTFFDELLPRDTALPEIEEYIYFFSHHFTDLGNRFPVI